MTDVHSPSRPTIPMHVVFISSGKFSGRKRSCDDVTDALATALPGDIDRAAWRAEASRAFQTRAIRSVLMKPKGDEGLIIVINQTVNEALAIYRNDVILRKTDPAKAEACQSTDTLKSFRYCVQDGMSVEASPVLIELGGGGP